MMLRKPLKLVKATQSDKAYMLQLRKLTMVEHLEISGQFLTEHEHLSRVNEAYASSHIILHKGTPIGMFKYLENDERIDIMQLQVSPEYQGQGLGQDVMRQMLDYAGRKTVELTVLKRNPALRLYIRLGFQITGEDEYEFFMSYNHKQ